MSYSRRQGAKWAGKHPVGSDILGICFGLFITFVGFAAGKENVAGYLVGIGGAAYLIYCISDLVMNLKSETPAAKPQPSVKTQPTVTAARANVHAANSSAGSQNLPFNEIKNFSSQKENVIKGKSPAGNDVFSSGIGTKTNTAPAGTSTAVNNAPRSSRTGDVIPDGTKWVTKGLLQGHTGLTSVVIPDSVEGIADGAFSGCRNLSSVVIPDSVVSVGSRAFEKCSGLKRFTMPIDMDYVSHDDRYEYHDGFNDKGEMFGGAELVSPKEQSSFYDCTGITEVTLTKGRTGMGHDYSAYEDFRGKTYYTPCSPFGRSGGTIEKVTVKKDVVRVGARMFGCCGNLKGLTIEDGVATIGAAAFANTSITRVSLPNSVTSVESYAFGSCSKLTEIFTRQDHPTMKTVDGVLFGGADKTVLHTCPAGKMGHYSVPDWVTDIFSFAFGGCRLLSEIEIPEGITRIRRYAFSQCAAITEIKLPPRLNRIEEHTFDCCEMLKKVVIPDGVEYIGDAAFYACTALETITIPARVKYMGDYVFSGCNNLKEVRFCGDAPECGRVQSEAAAVGWYPANNKTWTEEFRKKFFPNFTWKTWEPKSATESTAASAEQFSQDVSDNENVFLSAVSNPEKCTPSELYVSCTLFELCRLFRGEILDIVKGSNAAELKSVLGAAYYNVMSSPEEIGIPSQAMHSELDDTNPNYWNADIFTLANGDKAALLFAPVDGNGKLMARVAGVIFSDKGDGYYYCMVNKDANTPSPVFRSKGLAGVEEVGEVSGLGFELMNAYLACISKDFQQTAQK